MEFYPQYRIDDFFHKHGWEGGLTLPQVRTLYTCAMKRKGDDYRFQALLHGVNLDDSSSSSSSSKKPQQQPQNQSLPIFGDPEDYSHLSQEEKDKLTQNMMRQHQSWANNSTGNKIGS